MQNKIREYIVPNYNIFTEWRPEQHFQRLDKYSNYLWEEFRLETWEEVIARTVDTLRHLSNDNLPFPEYQRMFDMMYQLEIMPSMRLLSMPLRAIERCNTVLYNCTSGLGDTLKAIAEAQYLSMSGAGVTWSVEKKNVDKIPVIKHQTGMMYYHVVEDTQIGWARATERLLNELAKGNDLTIDYSRIRASGEPLKTKGGYASGPEILIKTHDFIRETFKNAQGRKLRPIEMHDMFCFALESGVSGGVRRCLSEDTEVITNNGLMKIKDIIPGDLAWTPEGYKKITNIFEQGKQAVTKITLSNGTTVEATENHRLAVVTKNGYEWRYVSEISLSDKLLLNGVEAKSGKNIEINIDIPGEHSHATTKLTKDYFTIDENFAWMFGKFLADGCVIHRVKNGVDSKQGISIATHTNEEVQREKLYNFFSSFGVNVANVEAKGENCFHTNIVNGQIGRTFGDFKTAKTDIRIPHFIKESPASVRAAFLAGLADGDGCLHTKNIVLVHTIYDTLRDDVINLYASLGIVAHSKTTIRKNGWKNIHKVSVKGLSNKKNLVALLSPFTTKKIYDFKLNMYDYNANGVLLSNMPDKRLVPVEISSIEREYKIVETFDIEVEEVHCFFANGVLSHNSAGMCIFDADETDILTCKYDGFWNHPIHKVRANANNSAVWGENLSKNDIIELTSQAFSTGTGEPNLFKRGNEFRNKPEWREFIHPEFIGTNPSLRKGTKILTDKGIIPIELLQDSNFKVKNLNGEWSDAKCFLSGKDKKLYKVMLSGGIEYFCTAEHKWPVLNQDGTYVKTETISLNKDDMLPISNANISDITFGDKGDREDGFLIGWLYGDGCVSESKTSKNKLRYRLVVSEDDVNSGILDKLDSILLNKFGKKSNWSIDSRRKKYVLATSLSSDAHFIYFNSFNVSKKVNGLPTKFHEFSKEFFLGFMDGLLSSDGYVTPEEKKSNGRCASVVSISFSEKYNKLANDILDILGFLGGNPYIRQRRNKFGEWIEISYTASNIQEITLTHSMKSKRLEAHKRKPSMKNFYLNRKIVSVEETELFEDVWDITVFDDTHCFSLGNIITGNCGEVTMQPIPVDSEYIKGGGWQFCNLSTVNARYNDDFNSLYEKTKYATLIGDIQSLATNFDFLREGTKTICDKDRLLGVNLVGYATSPFVRNNPKLVEALRDYTVEIDLKFAKQFNVPRSAAITAVKPSGNHSVLCYTAPGANPIHAEKQIRNVTVNKNSAMHLFLESQGVPKHDYPGRDYASMFSFPIDYPEGSITLEHTTAIDQLEMWKFHKVHWCQHNPSISITYTPDEIDAIRKWLYENQDIIGGLAFFPKYESSYELLPIVAVSDERYAEFTKDYPKISWEYYRLYEKAVDDRQQTSECAGGQCLIV